MVKNNLEPIRHFPNSLITFNQKFIFRSLRGKIADAIYNPYDRARGPRNPNEPHGAREVKTVLVEKGFMAGGKKAIDKQKELGDLGFTAYKHAFYAVLGSTMLVGYQLLKERNERKLLRRSKASEVAVNETKADKIFEKAMVTLSIGSCALLSASMWGTYYADEDISSIKAYDKSMKFPQHDTSGIEASREITEIHAQYMYVYGKESDVAWTEMREITAWLLEHPNGAVGFNEKGVIFFENSDDT